MDILEVIKRPEYDFLREQEHLGSHIDFLCFGGSVSYGLNGPDSDVDIRGICSPLKRDVLNHSSFVHPEDRDNKAILLNGSSGSFEQYLDPNTDTCIYNANKYIKLIYNCNPNTIEMLGCLPEHYAYVSETGRLILDNRDLFLTKKAYYTFGEYARQQFVRLQNSLVRKSTQLDSLLQTVSVIRRSYEHLEEAFPTFKRDMIEFYIVDSSLEKIDIKATNAFFSQVEVDKEKLTRELTEADLSNAELRVNVNMRDLTPKDLKGVVSEISNIVNNFSQHTGHRNNKKDAYHEDKHASHLKRLLITCKKIFKENAICTYCGDDIEELLDIKHGKYRQKDGSYQQEFFDMINKDMEELQELYMQSTLPKEPDVEKVFALIEKINETALNR